MSNVCSIGNIPKCGGCGRDTYKMVFSVETKRDSDPAVINPLYCERCDSYLVAGGMEKDIGVVASREVGCSILDIVSVRSV